MDFIIVPTVDFMRYGHLQVLDTFRRLSSNLDIYCITFHYKLVLNIFFSHLNSICSFFSIFTF